MLSTQQDALTHNKHVILLSLEIFNVMQWLFVRSLFTEQNDMTVWYVVSVHYDLICVPCAFLESTVPH